MHQYLSKRRSCNDLCLQQRASQGYQSATGLGRRARSNLVRQWVGYWGKMSYAPRLCLLQRDKCYESWREQYVQLDWSIFSEKSTVPGTARWMTSWKTYVSIRCKSKGDTLTFGKHCASCPSCCIQWLAPKSIWWEYLCCLWMISKPGIVSSVRTRKQAL